MKIFTIGFTKKTAETFFTALREAEVKTLVDVRLNNVSQLAGFAKKADLAYFVKEICNIQYVHIPLLGPTQELLTAYKKQKGAWRDYEKAFLRLIEERRIEIAIDRATLDRGCLLCSEDRPDRCHRRLVAEYLREHWGDVEIEHLV